MCGNGCATACRNRWKPPPLPASLFLSKKLNKLLKSIKTHTSKQNTGNRRTRHTTRREILKEKLFQNHSFFPPIFPFFFIFFLAIIELQLTLVCAPHYSLLFYYFVYFSLQKKILWLVPPSNELIISAHVSCVCVCNIRREWNNFFVFLFQKKKPL